MEVGRRQKEQQKRRKGKERSGEEMKTAVRDVDIYDTKDEENVCVICSQAPHMTPDAPQPHLPQQGQQVK